MFFFYLLFSWIFHPDNIKMVTLDGTPVS